MSLAHQTQPSPTSCTQTCLAMLLGEPVAKVIELLGDAGIDSRETHAALDRFRFIWNALVYPTLLWEGYYIVTTPSLNLPGKNHCVILEVEKDNGFTFEGVTLCDTSGRELELVDVWTDHPDGTLHVVTRPMANVELDLMRPLEGNSIL